MLLFDCLCERAPTGRQPQEYSNPISSNGSNGASHSNASVEIIPSVETVTAMLVCEDILEATTAACERAHWLCAACEESEESSHELDVAVIRDCFSTDEAVCMTLRLYDIS